VFEAKGLSEGDQEMAAVYSEVAVIDEVRGVARRRNGDADDGGGVHGRRRRRKSAPEIVPEFAAFRGAG